MTASKATKFEFTVICNNIYTLSVFESGKVRLANQNGIALSLSSIAFATNANGYAAQDALVRETARKAAAMPRKAAIAFLSGALNIAASSIK